MTLALSPREVKIVKCNGNNLLRNQKKHDVYALQPDYLSQSIVVIGVCLCPPACCLDSLLRSVLIANQTQCQRPFILFRLILFPDDLPDDRNCENCVLCCIHYDSWLSFQNVLYKIVKDPLFELFITLCIVLNTTFLALEHHGMSETVRSILDVGNKVTELWVSTRTRN